MASLLDPGATKLYLGAALVGPVLAVRGVYFLVQYYGSPRPVERPPPAEAAALYERDIRQGRAPSEVACEACGQAYVYFPAGAARAQAAKLAPEAADIAAVAALMKGRAVAPCPRCGLFQRDMCAPAQDQAPVSALLYVGLVILFCSAMFFLYVMSSVVTPAMRQPEESSSVHLYWLANAALVLLGAGLTVVGWLQSRRWDPNAQPAEARLRLAKQVSLSREEYDRLVQARELSPRDGDAEPPPA